MAKIDWRLKGEWVKNCNCAFGCPCDFNALPTHGNCQGLVAMNITDGYFGKVNLKGLSFAATVDFPGALHQGNGTLQPIIDAKATQEQREALLGIMSGQNSDEGTLFNIFSLIVTNLLEPIYAPIDFRFDKNGRTAKIVIPGVLETEVEPIRNPVTGQPHRIQVTMPEGFEHRSAEVADAKINAMQGIKFKVASGHSSLATVEHGPSGVIA